MQKFDIKKVPTAAIILLIVSVFIFALGINKTSVKSTEKDFYDIVVLDNGITDKENNGKFILANGTLTPLTTVTDTLTGVSVDGLLLLRKVEMYQYCITYAREPELMFAEGEKYDISTPNKTVIHNPKLPEGIEQSAFFFSDVKLNNGNLTVDENYLYTLIDDTQKNTGAYGVLSTLNFSESDVKTLPNGFKLSGGYITNGDVENPSLGDVRISYMYLPADASKTYSLFGKQDDMIIGKDKSSVGFIRKDVKTAEGAREQLFNESKNSAAGFFAIGIILVAVAVIITLLKMKKLKNSSLKAVSVVLVFLLIASLPVRAFADFGNFAGNNDYGGNNVIGNDNGNNGNDSYGGNNIDDTSERRNKYRYLIPKDSDGADTTGIIGYSSDYKKLQPQLLLTPESANDSDLTALLGVGVVCAVAIIAVVIIRKRGGRKSSKKPYVPYENNGVTRNNDNSVEQIETHRPQGLKPIMTYTSLDPNFSEIDLKEKLSNLYIQLQNAWTDKNLEVLRPYLADALYAQYDRQLDNFRKTKSTNYIDRIAVLSVSFTGYKQEGENDVIVSRVRSRIVDYTLNDADGALISGDRNTEKFMTYEWTLTRKSGVVTGTSDGIRGVNCPNCGAPVDINKSAKCEYCGSVLTVGASDWVIQNIKPLNQRSGRI